MDALLKEIEEMEVETPVVEETKEEVVEKPVESAPEPEQKQEEKPVDEPAADEEAEKQKAAQEAYRERQRVKKEEAARKAEEAAKKAELEKALQEDAEKRKSTQETDAAKVLAEKLAAVDGILYKQKIQEWQAAAERELNSLEKEFKVVFTDYDDLVSTALDITKDRMIQGGMTEFEAAEALRLEKLKIADAAAARGEDPVEAVYKEAKAINSWFETYATKLGYVKQGAQTKPLTQKAALREASKPNAIGSGKGTAAIKPSYDDMDDVSDLTIGQMLSGKF